jgi:hypothetical protein
MEGVPGIDFDDAFVLEFARACPALTHFSIGTEWSTGRRSRATLMSYIHLLEHCADLSAIGLVVDASTVTLNPSTNPAKNIKKTFNSISDEYFNFGDSYIEDSNPVAAFLSALVDPDCEEEPHIFTSDDCLFDIETQWRSVQQLVPLYVAVRAQERLGSNS